MEKSAWIYICLTLGTVALALLIQKREVAPACRKAGRAYGQWTPCTRRDALNRVTVFAIFCLLTAVSACRFALGNDYWTYRENFKRIFYDAHVSSEIGFNLVVKGLVALFGYDNYLPLFAVFSLLTVFFFIRAICDQGESFAFSLFLLLTGGYYFQSFNTIRYYLALAMAIYSMKYVLRREWGKFLLIIFISAAFHKTVLIVVPVFFVASYLARTGLKKWHMIIAAIFIASLIFGQELYRWIIFRFYPFYENTGFDVKHISYVNVAKCLGTLALAVILFWEGRKEEGERFTVAMRFYLWLNVFGGIAFLCGGFIPEVSRIGFYFIASQIFLIPDLACRIRGKWLGRVCKWGSILAFSLYFVLLLKQMYQTDIRILPYMSWIFYYK